MNPSAHLIFSATAFGRPGKGILVAALLGGLTPDLSLFLMAGVSLFILNIEPARVFGELYYSDAWQFVFSIDNSFPIWGTVLGIALYFRHQILTAFASASLLHLTTDFLLHNDDARVQFWPLSDWVFRSPLSYWDVRYGALWVAPVLAAISLGFTVLLWRRHKNWRLRLLWVLLMGIEAMILFGHSV